MIKNYLKQIRESKNIKAEAIAEAIGKTPQLIWKFERGDGSLSVDSLIKIARFLNVSTDYILTGKEPQPEKTEYPIKKELLSYAMDIVDEAFRNELEELSKSERIDLIDSVYNLVYEHFENRNKEIATKVEHRVRIEKGFMNLVKKYGNSTG